MILTSDPDSITNLDIILGKIESIAREGDENAYYDARFEYAQIGLDVTDNPLLKEIVMDFVPSLMRVQHVALKQRINNIAETVSYLREINESMKARDVEQGLAALRALLSNDMAFALRAIRECPPDIKGPSIPR